MNILNVTNYLITKWSSVIYECQSFINIPVIVSEMGKELSSKKVDRGLFLFTINKSSLKTILMNKYDLPTDTEPFIIYDNDT